MIRGLIIAWVVFCDYLFIPLAIAAAMIANVQTAHAQEYALDPGEQVIQAPTQQPAYRPSKQPPMVVIVVPQQPEPIHTGRPLVKYPLTPGEMPRYPLSDSAYLRSIEAAKSSKAWYNKSYW